MNGAQRDSLQRALIGALLAAALFLLEAGWAEITMAQNAECIQGLRGMRIPPPATVACASELQLYLSKALSLGIVGVFRPEWSSLVAWMVMAVLYAGLGAVFAQLSPRHGVPAYLATHLVLVMGLTMSGYLSQFIV